MSDSEYPDFYLYPLRRFKKRTLSHGELFLKPEKWNLLLPVQKENTAQAPSTGSAGNFSSSKIIQIKHIRRRGIGCPESQMRIPIIRYQ